MRPVAPRVPGLPEATLGEEQAEYATITVAIHHSTVQYPGMTQYVTRWRLSVADRLSVAAGHDLYVVQLAAGSMSPMLVSMVPPFLSP